MKKENENERKGRIKNLIFLKLSFTIILQRKNIFSTQSYALDCGVWWFNFFVDVHFLKHAISKIY